MRSTDSCESIVAVEGITRRFGEKVALNNVTISLQRGKVLGLVGENGAGKTTLIKHILGLLKPNAGTVRVFGLNPATDPVGVLSRIGYLSEEDGLPAWMTVAELQRYARAFYANWDQRYAEQLRAEFGLEANARLKHLSKGQRARAGLMLALSYRPDLLLLDEPSSGLDPIVRRDILGAIIRTIADEGRSVLFSSHLLGEVERVADNVAMIRAGRVEFCGELDTVKESHFLATLRFDEARSAPPSIAGAFAWSGSGREWSALFSGSVAALEATAAVLSAEVLEHRWPTLDEIFMARSAGEAPVEV
jgi:ABC-2 type transport system ATP-binding protein